MQKELGLSLLLLSLLFFLFDPFHMLMLTSMQMLVLCAVAVTALAYGVFLFRSRSHDEREQLHLFVASRIGFLLGAGVLTVAIVLQKIAHQDVAWLILSLAGMVLGKIIGLLYAQYTQ